MTADEREIEDLRQLLAMPAFARFLFRSIQMAGILFPTTDGADGRNLISEGRRSLGLDILRDVERGQPEPRDLIVTLTQALLTEAQSKPQEKPRGRRSRYDSEPDE